MEKSNLLLPASIVAAAVILAYSVSTLNNTLRCTSAYGAPAVLVGLAKKEDGYQHRKAVRRVRATGCNDKWTRTRGAGQ